MEESSSVSDELPFELTWSRIILLGIFLLLLVYLTAAITNFVRLEPRERTLMAFLVPFDTGPTARALHEKGVHNLRSGQYRQAVRYFTRSLDKDGAYPKGLFLLASAHAKLGNFQGAFETMAMAGELDPNLPRIDIKQAYWLLGLGEYDRAVSKATLYIDRDSVQSANKLYGTLILFESYRALNHSDTEKTLETLKQLHQSVGGWPSKLVKLLLEDPKVTSLETELNPGEETELRAWLAIRDYVDGKTNQAEKNMNWVLENGITSRYEFDMMLALKTQLSG